VAALAPFRAQDALNPFHKLALYALGFLWTLNFLSPLDSLYALGFLRTLNFLSPLDALYALGFLWTLNFLSPLNSLRPREFRPLFNAFNLLRAFHFRMLNSLQALHWFNLFWPFYFRNIQSFHLRRTFRYGAAPLRRSFNSVF
jgi:hypothetical protein